MKRVVRGFVLDLFGVLVSGNSRIFYEELIREARLNLNHQIWSNLYTKASSGDIRYGTFVEKVASQISMLADEVEAKLKDVVSKNARVINSGYAFLSQLKEIGVPSLILTNGISEWVEILEEKLSLRNLVSEILISSAIRVRKPELKAYLLAAKALGTSPEELAYVGDEDEDIRGAKNVGMRGVFIAGEDTVSPSCDYEVSDLGEIMDLPLLELKPKNDDP